MCIRVFCFQLSSISYFCTPQAIKYRKQILSVIVTDSFSYAINLKYTLKMPNNSVEVRKYININKATMSFSIDDNKKNSIPFSIKTDSGLFRIID